MSKQSRHRDCPALTRPISSADCGSGRHSSIACPVSCPHNPFAPAAYDAFLDLETKIDRAALDRLASEFGRPRVEQLVASRLPDDLADLQDQSLAVNAAVLRALYFQRDPAGRSIADHWLADPSARLANDERILLAAKNRLRPALVEIREVRPDGLLRAADLLAPEEGEFDLMDRATWARAVRFGVMLVWKYPLPHYHRIFGGGVTWPDWSGLSIAPADALAEVVAHAGGPAASAPARERADWIARNFLDVIRRVFAVTRVRHRDMVAGVDVVHGWAEFTPPTAAAKRLLRHLKKSPDIFPSDPDPNDDVPAGYTEAWEWCEAASVASPTGAPGRVLIGRVLRRDDTWRVVAFGRARLARLRENFLAALGDPALAPTREYMQDLAAQLAQKEPAHDTDAALVPPRLRADPARLDFSTTRLDGPPEVTSAAHIRARLLDDWADRPLPALDNRTPRAAIHDPAARATVVHLLKHQIAESDRARLRGRPFTDPTPLAVELGLAELDRPAPPERPCPPELIENDEDDPSHLADDLAPPLQPVTHKLDPDEAADRANAIYQRFPTDDALLDAWDEACPGFADIVADHTPDDFTDEEIEDVEFALALVWAILSGGDTRELDLDLDRIALAANSSREGLSATTPADKDALSEIIIPVLTRQPGLVRILIDDLQARTTAQGRKENSAPIGEIMHWLGATLPLYLAALARR